MVRPPKRKEDRMRTRMVAAWWAVASGCVGTLAVATPGPSQSDTKSVTGVVSQVDMNAKSMVIKDATGNEVTVYWNEATKVNGDLREGSTVKIDTREQDGKTWATSID